MADKKEEINDIDLEELAKQIKRGNTSGRLDSEIDDGGTKHISWELKTEVWKD